MNGNYGIGLQVSSVDPEGGAALRAGADLAVGNDRHPDHRCGGHFSANDVQVGLRGLITFLYNLIKQ